MADNNIDPELIRELTEKYEQMRNAMASMIPAMVLSTTAINQMVAASKKLKVSEEEGKDVVDKFIKSVKKATEENEVSAKKEEDLNKKKAQREKFVDAEINALKQFGSALLTTGDGMAKYGKSLNGATSALGEFISKMGPIGFVIGNLIKGLGFLTEQVFKQNDAMLKAYDSLSEVGATSSLTTTDIRKLGLSAGYTSERLDKFTDITKDLGSNLVALGGSASKGVVAFSDIAAIGREQREGFNNLGISQEQVTKIQANYIKQTTQAGMVLAKSPEQLRKESTKYIDALVELAALTGISVQKQQEALDIANADENFNQYKASQSMKRQALLEQAENEQDQTRKKSLLAQADQIDSIIKAKDAYAKTAVSTMSAANAAAVLQSISTDGATAYTESNAKLLMAGIDIAKHNKEMNAGRSQEVELLESQVKAVRRFTTMFGNSANAYGEYSKELQKEFGVDNKMRVTAAEFELLKTEEGKKQFLAQRKLNQQELDAKKAGLGPNDAAKKAQNAQLTAELAAQAALNELTALISGPVTGGFTLLMKAVSSLGKVFADMMFKITKGETDLRHLFKTPEELKQDIEDITKEVKVLESSLSKENKLREEKIKVDQDLIDKEKKLATETGDAKAKTQREIRALQDKQTELAKQLAKSAGFGPSETNVALTEKRKQLEIAKKRAAEVGAVTAPAIPVPSKATPTTAGPKTVKQLEQQQARDTAAANLGTGVDGKKAEDILSKIKFKNRKEATGGGSADPKLLDMAQKISEILPGSTFTSLNDVYHQNRKDDRGQRIYSKHMDGKALDFTIDPPPENADAAAIIKEQLKDLGASKVLDEYFADKNAQTRGGHFHVEVMKDGGIIQSQPGGTLVQAAEAGMNEAFVPLPKGKNIPVSMPSLDKLTASNKILAEDLRLLVGGNGANSPLIDTLSNKLTEKLDPEKLLLNVLSKNVPGIGKMMTANNLVGIAGGDDMSTADKLLEIAKVLNPTVRLVSKLYDAYKTVTDMPNVDSLVSSQTQQQQSSQQELLTKLSTAIATPASNTDSTREIVELLADKLDTVINKLDTGNNLQEDFNKQSQI